MDTLGVYNDRRLVCARLCFGLRCSGIRHNGISGLRDRWSCTGSSRPPHDTNDLGGMRICMRVKTVSMGSGVVHLAWVVPVHLRAVTHDDMRCTRKGNAGVAFNIPELHDDVAADSVLY